MPPDRNQSPPTSLLFPILFSIILLAAGLLLAGKTSDRALAGEWPVYGRDPEGTRYSPLAEINRRNVGNLQVAWTCRTGEDSKKFRKGGDSAFEATPIMVDGGLYLSTPTNRVLALDPESGEVRWTFDPNINPSVGYSELTSRGVSTWIGPTGGQPGRQRRLIFVATIDARLIALDAATGKPFADFGEAGQVDLTRDIRIVDRADYQVTSPPAVVGDLVIVGSSIGDNRGVELERGVVRAYDCRSGKLRWTWDPIPADSTDPAFRTWEQESGRRTGAANAWSILSADPARNLVFVPTSSPSPDYYGGERLGDNLYANSVVALRASTGKVVWYFQVVHHDLWDYDVASQPVLFMLNRRNTQIPAVAVGTKIGHVFVLHRETGKPLFPVEERTVPASNVPGERSSVTQPFPVMPKTLVPQKLTPEDAWGFNDADRDWCRDRIRSLRSEGVFTPPSLEGSVAFPGNVGGMHWGGLSYHSKRSLLITNTNRIATMIRLIPRADVQKFRADAGNRLGGEFGRQTGTPYVMYREILASPNRVPCNPPPWGALSAVSMADGALRWEVPLGTIPHLSSVPASSNWGSPNLGGTITTAGDLIFVGAAMDEYLRAFDVETGREVWKGKLPASAQATPMTYTSPKSGKQFVVIAAGGHGKLGTKKGDYVVAFKLP